MYNVIYCSKVGDKVLRAQVENPHEFVEMNYPSASLNSEDSESIDWNMDNGDVVIVAVPIRNIVLDILIPESEYNKILRL